MKTVREFCLGRTIMVIGAMFVCAWGSQQAALREDVRTLWLSHGDLRSRIEILEERRS
jgi:hypothetical protein